MGDAMDGCRSDPKKTFMRFHANWGHASAQQLRWVSVDFERENAHLAKYVEEVSEQCDVCRAFEKAPHVPIAGTPTVSKFNGKLHVDLLFLGDSVALRTTDILSKCSLVVPARPKNS